MTTRAKLNLFAAAIITVGATALSRPTPAQATEFDPCEAMHAALAEASSQCWNTPNAVNFTYSGSCGAGGWTLKTNCYVQLM
jgi:hypothetical protein